VQQNSTQMQLLLPSILKEFLPRTASHSTKAFREQFLIPLKRLNHRQRERADTITCDLKRNRERASAVLLTAKRRVFI